LLPLIQHITLAISYTLTRLYAETNFFVVILSIMLHTSHKTLYPPHLYIQVAKPEFVKSLIGNNFTSASSCYPWFIPFLQLLHTYKAQKTLQRCDNLHHNDSLQQQST